MQVDLDLLFKYHEAGRLRHSLDTESLYGDCTNPLHVWCYGPATAYNDDWDETTMLCRGLVTDNEGTVISRPFRKFFNWGQPRAPGPEITSKPFWAFDKMDGTLIIVGNRDGEAVVSTKGSFNTWHSEFAREALSGYVPVPGSTALFELVGPRNKIVCDYSDDELILLGAVWNETGEDHFTPENYADESGWFGKLAPPRAFNLQHMLATVADPENGPNREGFVLVWPNAGRPSDRVKIKFAQYVRLHAVLSRINNVAVWEALRDGTFEALLEIVPDEIYDKVKECADDLLAQFDRVLARANWHAQMAGPVHYDNRREAAAYVLGQNEVDSKIVFAAMDNKPNLGRLIWDKLRPRLDQTWTFLK